MKVLIVDDDDALRAVWLDVYSHAGHDPTAVSNLADARDALHISPYDVVLLDLYVGNELGLPLATLASYVNPDCRVIVITGSPVFAMGELFELAPSIATVLRKPVDVEELLAVSEHGLLP